MSRADVAIKLLALGPLTRAEFVEVTGWPLSSACWVICRLRDRGLVRLSRAGRTAVWSLVEGNGAAQ